MNIINRQRHVRPPQQFGFLCGGWKNKCSSSWGELHPNTSFASSMVSADRTKDRLSKMERLRRRSAKYASRNAPNIEWPPDGCMMRSSSATELLPSKPRQSMAIEGHSSKCMRHNVWGRRCQRLRSGRAGPESAKGCRATGPFKHVLSVADRLTPANHVIPQQPAVITSHVRVCVQACVPACMQVRERERERETHKQRERETPSRRIGVDVPKRVWNDPARKEVKCLYVMLIRAWQADEGEPLAELFYGFAN